MMLDTACSSSLTALDLAFSAIRSGECEAAIVAGVNLTLSPMVTYRFAKLGVLTYDQCRPFDERSQGYVRSEAITSVFLQKIKVK